MLQAPHDSQVPLERQTKKAPVSLTGGSGFRFENCVAARFLLDLLGQTNQFGAAQFGRVVSVQWQTRDSGWLLDDLAVTSLLNDTKRIAAISIKSGQKVTSNGFPIEFRNNVWAQWLRQGTERDIHSTTDVLSLITGDSAQGPKTAWNDLLGQILVTPPERIISRLTSTKEEGSQASEDQRALVNNFSCPDNLSGDSMAAEEKVKVLGRVRWIDWDYEKSNSQALGQAIADCKSVLAPDQVERADELWDRLISIADEFRPLGGTLDFAGLLAKLRKDFRLKNNPDFEHDWSLLNRRSQIEMGDIRGEIAGTKLQRIDTTQNIKQALEAKGSCFLVGESGSGKSALTKEYVLSTYKNIIWLNASILKHPSIVDWEKHLGLQHTLGEIVAKSPSECAIIFDAVENFTDETIRVATQVLKSVSTLDNKDHIHVFFSAQPGSAQNTVKEIAISGSLSAIPDPTVVSNITINNLQELLANRPQIKWAALQPELRKLLTNLKTLDWFIQSIHIDSSFDNSSIVGLTTLIDLLWKRLIPNGDKKYACANLLKQIATIEADEHINSVECMRLEHAAQATLATLDNAGLVTVREERVHFTHDLLCDWARLQVLIGRDWIKKDAERKAITSPRWHRAMRLYGQRLLETSNGNLANWHAAISTVDDNSTNGKLIRDLFLEALFMAPNAKELLELAWPVLIMGQGKLLQILLDRFLISGTLADMRVLALADANNDSTSYEHLVRIPFHPIWPPVILVLRHHMAEIIKLAPQISSKICEMWLSYAPQEAQSGYYIPGRREAAELAIAIAKEMHAENEEGGFRSGGADKHVYAALLHAANDFPQETGALCLEIAKRRDLDPALKARVQKYRKEKAEERRKQQGIKKSRHSLPVAHPFERRREPWPDGPRDHIDSDFSKACLEGNAFDLLVKSNPDIAVEVLLAVCIEAPDYEISHSPYTPETGLIYWHQNYPPAFFKGPFLLFFRRAPEQAITFMMRLCNFATKCYVKQNVGVKINVGGQQKLWRGTGNIFAWSRGYHLSNGEVLESTLMACEKWLYEQIEAGVDITKWITRIMHESESIAFAGLLISIGKKAPEYLTGALKPMLETWELLELDFQLTSQRNIGLGLGLGFGAHPVGWMVKLIENWNNLQHRSILLLDQVTALFTPHPEHAEWLGMIRGNLERELANEEDPHHLQMLIARLTPENYEYAIVDGKRVPIKLNLPTSLASQVNKNTQVATERLTFLRLPTHCRDLIDQKKKLSDTEALKLFELIKSFHAQSGKGPFEPEMPEKIYDVLLGGISTLYVLRYDWLRQNNGALEWCRTRLSDIAANPPNRGLLDHPTSIGADNWEAFAAECGILMLTKNQSDQLARKLVVRGVMAFRYSTTEQTIRTAVQLRSELGSDFERILHLTMEWSGLRPMQWMLSPMFSGDMKEWEERRLTVEQQFMTSALEPKLPAISEINTRTLTQIKKLNKKANKNVGLSEEDDDVPVLVGSRIELYPKHPGFDPGTLKALSPWLVNSIASEAAQKGQAIEFIRELFKISLDQIPKIQDPLVEEIKGTPSDFNSWVFELVAIVIPSLAETENPEAWWQPIMNLGDSAHDWVKQFFTAWFTTGIAQKNSQRFFSTWRAMIDFALSSPEWDPKNCRTYNLDNMVIELLGFNMLWLWTKNEKNIPHIASMIDLFQQAAVRWFSMPDVLKHFVSFAGSIVGAPLMLKGINWVASAVKSYSEYNWRYDLDEYVVSFLNNCWQQHAGAIAEQESLRKDFFSILLILVARGNHGAISLRDRVANIKH